MHWNTRKLFNNNSDAAGATTKRILRISSKHHDSESPLLEARDETWQKEIFEKLPPRDLNKIKSEMKVFKINNGQK